MQDWPLEVATSERLDEFIAYYLQPQLDDDLRFAAMELIIASFDEATPETKDSLWPRIRALLSARLELHAYTIYDWARWDADDLDDEEQQFASSRFLREIPL